MRIAFFLIILGPCYALETVICERLSGSYDCQVYSPHEEEYLSDVVHVYESEGMNTIQDQYEAEDALEKESEKEPEKDYIPFIFSRPVFW